MSSHISSIYSQDNLNLPVLTGVYEFDRFRLDAVNLMLYENDASIALAPKVVETLVALVEKSGALVSKDALMARLWKDAFVEESNLTQNIYLLRKTLGAAENGQPFIETFRRRGYRFTGKIKAAADETKTVEENQAPALKTAEVFFGDNTREGFNSLIVLPLKNETADTNLEYLGDGITDSLINRLSAISRLRVVARNTAFQYKNKDVAPQEIGAKLGVKAVLSGRILQHDERLIVRVELVDAASGWQLWGTQYDRRATDVLELQETLAWEISKGLHVKLTAEEEKRLTKRYTESTEAYHLYLKGRHFLNKRMTEAIKQAAFYFQQSIETDPAYAPAYVGLADCFPLLNLYGALTPRDAYPKAKAAALKALEIDDRYTKAYNSLGVVKLFYEWDWTGAEEALRQAIELNPGYPDAHLRYGMFLTAMQRFAEAETEFQQAENLDPLSLITKTIGGYPFYYSRQYEKAACRFISVIATDENYSMAHFRLGLTYAQQKNYEQAAAELQKSISLSNDRDAIATLGYVQGLSGSRADAENTLAELARREKQGFVSAYNRVLIYSGLGEIDAALDWLERACEERSYWLIYLKVDPALDDLRSHERFLEIQRKIFGV